MASLFYYDDHHWKTRFFYRLWSATADTDDDDGQESGEGEKKTATMGG